MWPRWFQRWLVFIWVELLILRWQRTKHVHADHANNVRDNSVSKNLQRVVNVNEGFCSSVHQAAREAAHLLAARAVHVVYKF